MRGTDILEALAECLCEQIEASSVPGVCFCGVIPGDGIVVDYAGNCRDGKQGMAWVRLTAMYPAEGLNVVSERVNNCGSSIGLDLELGIVRPVAVADHRARAPSADAYRAAGRLMNDDALVMLRALKCCETLQDLDHIVGTYNPAGPEGGVVGGTWPVATILD